MGNKNSGKPKGIPKYSDGDIINDGKRNLHILNSFYVPKLRKTSNKASGYGYKNKIYYNIDCNICGANFQMEQSNLFHRKDNCPCCSNKRVFVGINDVATTNPELIIYFKNKEKAKEYTIRSNKKETMVCPICKHEKYMSITELSTYGFACSKCSDGISYPNKFSYALLEQLPVLNVKHEYIFNSDKNYRFDNFFIYKDKKYVLEMDGSQHFQDSLFGSYQNQSENDSIKNNIAEKNNCKMIRIDCQKSDMNYIKSNIISSDLSKLFDLSNIDWDKCHKFALGNMFMYVVDMFNLGYSNDDIINKYHISSNTINKYLLNGEKLNLLTRSRFENTITIAERNIKQKIENICEYKYKHPKDDFKTICSVLKINEYKYKKYMIQFFEDGVIDYDIKPELELRINNSLSNLTGSKEKKSVYMYDKNLTLLGIFDSGVDLINQTNLELTVKGIQKVCSHTQKTHRGYIFSYEPLFSETEIAEKM